MTTPADALRVVMAAAKLIVDGAIPATTSGQTSFVPTYQIGSLRVALAEYERAAIATTEQAHD